MPSGETSLGTIALSDDVSWERALAQERRKRAGMMVDDGGIDGITYARDARHPPLPPSSYSHLQTTVRLEKERYG